MTDAPTAGEALHSLPPPIVEPVRGALIAPVGPAPGFANGVFRADGSFCPISQTRLTDNRLTAIPTRPDRAEVLGTLPGTTLFGGIGRHHFGHFLLETVTRLWALDGREHRFSGMVLLPMPGMDFGATLRRRMLAFFQLMGCDMPLHLVKTPVIADELLLPAQGFGHMEWAIGTEEFRRFVRSRIDRTCPPAGPDKIYVSRSRLKHPYQRLDQEERIEKLMKSAGYTVFHPQRHSIRSQCQVYRAAHTIVGGDGSAFHLAPFAMQPETRVGLIQRRPRQDQVDAIANQIRAFTRIDLVWLNPLKDAGAQPVPRSDPDKQLFPISFRRLRAQLEENGLI